MTASVEWRDIEGWPYQVSNGGLVRNTRTEHILKPDTIKGGYLRVTLSNKGVIKRFLVNRLVCTAFNGSPPSAKHQARHSNGKPIDNVPLNLEWGLAKHNALDRVMHGNSGHGEQSWSAKYSDELAAKVRAEYRRIKGAAKYAPDGIYEAVADQFDLTRRQVLHLVHARWSK